MVHFQKLNFSTKSWRVAFATGRNLEQRLIAGIKIDEDNSLKFYEFDAVRYVPFKWEWSLVKMINFKKFWLFYFLLLFLFGCTVSKPAPVESHSISKQKKSMKRVFHRKKNLTSDGFYIVQSGDTLFGIAPLSVKIGEMCIMERSYRSQ